MLFRSKGRTIGYIIEEYIGKLGKKLFLLFCWLFCILVVAAFADVVAGTFNGFTADGAKIPANGSVATTSMLFILEAVALGVLLRFSKLNKWVNTFIAIALLVGGIYLLCRKVITWHVPVSFIGSVALLTLIFGHEGYTHVDWMLCNLLTGGLFLGAIFMATDYATCPVTTKGRLIYGIGCGALTVLIRYFGGFPEGVTFAILIMNACAWALDKTPRRQFGETKEDIATAKAAEKAAKKSLKEGA